MIPSSIPGITTGGAHECSARVAGPAERGAEVRPAATAGVRGQDRGGVAAQRRAGLHHPPAPGARRAGGVRRSGGRGPAEGLQDHPCRWSRACPVASDPTGDDAPAARRARHQGAGGHADAQRGRARAHPAPPSAPGGADAAVHPSQGRSTRARRWAGAGRRRRGVPSRGGRPMARRRRRPPGAAPRRRSGRGCCRAATTGSQIGGSGMTAVLELRQVSKVYGSGPTEVQALREVDLSVDGGELVAVMGPSGSGKSTLLTIAGSLEEPTSGEVLVQGAALAGMSRNDRARMRRRSIGFVFQDFNMLAGLTAVENVALPLELDRVGRDGARTTGLAALEELGLADRAARYPDELSGGERQRVAIARAVVGDRRLVLADEPTGALDSVNGEGVMRLLRAACKRGVAGVVVTHDAQLASWADRVVFLRDGRVVDQTARPPGAESLLTRGPNP